MEPHLSTRRISSAALYLTVFVPFALGHYVSFLFRSINAVLSPFLVESLQLNAAQLGLLSSAYFVAFGLAQLPVGIALDRFGPRRVQPVLLGVAAAGSLMFAFSSSFGALFVARALTGLGLAACFMGAIKALSSWVPPQKRPSVNGYLLAVGGLGAMSATLPAQIALELFSWRGLFAGLAVLTLAPALLIHFATPPEPPAQGVPRRITAASLLEVYRDRQFLRTAALLLPSHAVAFGLQGLWMGQWMQDVAGLDARAVANYLFWGMGAIIVGSLTVGHVAEWAQRRHGMKPLDVAGIGVALFVCVQLLACLNIVALIPALTIAFTLVGTIAGLDYTIVSQSVPASMTGRAATSLNVLIFMGAFVVQGGFGLVVGAWGADIANHYPPVAYQAAFGAAVLIQLPGLIGWLLGRRGRAGQERMQP
ncbi:MFS transporter [Ramlibacter sp.]|uniref:MFS transporter n=1 Tax=Ramlibacter sp. TaxID=1917967 RepID=UPI0025F9AA87|nr:MFS transporter [Ramlibacter sp.]